MVMIIERNYGILQAVIDNFLFFISQKKIDLIKVYLIPYYSWA